MAKSKIPMIYVSHLCKSYGPVKAVQDVSFQVERGALFAFLGVNGAGKSTTISVLCGNLKKDSGTVQINGKNPDESPMEIKRALGIVFQQSMLDTALSPWDNLQNRAALYDIKGTAFAARYRELSTLLSFEEFGNRAVGKLSGGQRRRIDIARALLHRPQILILDEPTTGLDPQTRRVLWQVIEQLRREEGLTVFLTTHYMEEAADADYVVILDSGRIVAEGSPLELKNTYTGDYITLYGANESEVAALGYPFQKLPNGYRIAVPDTKTAAQLIAAHPTLFGDFEVVKGKMDDVFLAVTGKTSESGEDSIV